MPNDSMAKPRSKSRAREATPQDFKFGPILGFGSYSEVRPPPSAPAVCVNMAAG